MKPEPTVIKKIEDLPNYGEIEGFEAQITKDGRMTDEIKAAIARRRRELSRTS